MVAHWADLAIPRLGFQYSRHFRSSQRFSSLHSSGNARVLITATSQLPDLAEMFHQVGVYTGSILKGAKIWDAAGSGRQLAVMNGHLKYVLAADMSPDEKLLVTGGGDKVLNLWEVASGRLIGRMQGHTSDIEAVAFAPNGKVVVSASEDKSVIIWSVENREELARLFFQKNGDKYAGVTFQNQAFGERNSGLLSVYVDGRLVSETEAERAVHYIGRRIAIIENEN
jgi:WD40 repeat protein